MKHLLTAIIFAASAIAQVAINPPAVSLNSEAVASIQAWMLTQRTDSTVTLTNAVSVNATALRVSDGAGLNGKAIVIDGEAYLVTARNGRDLTVTPAQLGTTTALHEANSVVSVLKYSDLRSLAKQIVLDKMREIVRVNPTATILTKRQQQATLEAEIVAAREAAVQ